MSRHPPPSAAPLTALDWIGAALAWLLALALLLFPLVVLPSFRAMFSDLGGELPQLTRLVLTPWPALGLGATAAASTAAGVALLRSGVGLRRGLIVAGFFVALLGLGLCLAGVYLPIVELAGAVTSGA